MHTGTGTWKIIEIFQSLLSRNTGEREGERETVVNTIYTWIYEDLFVAIIKIVRVAFNWNSILILFENPLPSQRKQWTFSMNECLEWK